MLSRLDKVGLRVKRGKCEFMQSSVTYLGHKIDASGGFRGGKGDAVAPPFGRWSALFSPAAGWTI